MYLYQPLDPHLERISRATSGLGLNLLGDDKLSADRGRPWLIMSSKRGPSVLVRGFSSFSSCS